MNYWLNITARAREDITRNAVWWAERHSLEQALRWYDGVYEQIQEVLQFPESHSLAPENELFAYEIRQKPVGGRKRTYRALFTIVNAEIRILAVRRTSEELLDPAEL